MEAKDEVNNYYKLVLKRILDRIEGKTSWGKNELKDMILECLVEEEEIEAMGE
jgi:hypothetical protein